MTIIAWQYDADRYCQDCTEHKYPDSTRDKPTRTPNLDSEGNPIAPLFAWDEWYDPDMYEQGCVPLACADCDTILDVAHDQDCPNAILPDTYDTTRGCIPLELT